MAFCVFYLLAVSIHSYSVSLHIDQIVLSALLAMTLIPLGDQTSGLRYELRVATSSLISVLLFSSLGVVSCWRDFIESSGSPPTLPRGYMYTVGKQSNSQTDIFSKADEFI